eukprot:CAMPEP_0194142276 /NCGR_PEP_ID=MMETSP0152-20130528/11585_1 /TAXON_ID=1049557 /ORGANISM="Thalassiothrix antarctica, Strain L6-D1" /LENGTH=257 /DNA_ID=CAMNT_0038841191 /DNA_START=466 /DNA_END=1239 /DNA_ORIENTATION=+
MLFRLTVLTTLMVNNIYLVDGSGQCFCPAKVNSNGVVAGECKNSNEGGSSKAYAKFTIVNTNRATGQHRCSQLCEDEGNTCQGWAFRDDNITLSTDENNCHLYDYTPDTTKKNKENAENWLCQQKGTLVDTFSFLGDGVCQGGGSSYTQVRAYSGPSDSQNDGKIESVEECKEFCMNNVEIEDEYFFYEPPTPNKPGSACEGFNFITEKCGPSNNLRDRCSTNCFLYGTEPTGNRTRASRRQNYDNYSCYTRDCSCD